ncbi:MAG: outer membrane beta-barrel protein [Leptospiraceae bacterium]|nr:outer membrane beta-barrel protein [Leptospiraceae bacterium]MBK7054293.1 outer membrane beta-barrel protein [Leptospiraceae bacterium]MBK9499585.1 outer membrane beta-barrel protein [Leptospiraceae bacterium]MBL0266193.1 outer membrane beta-barrel protein [Leptospiraceae bacterium]MBP9164164.1 outer membrane beta-barrel protein [Leptospiraceae bacterium]
MKKILFLLILYFLNFTRSTFSQSIVEQIKFGSFIDTYYAYDLEKPPSQDRAYTTSAARNNAFNINLLYLDVNLNSEKIRGRGAVHYGTSVTANYLGESTESKIANQFSVRNMQEGFIGFKLAPKLWLDAGIYFSHIGFGNFISRENWSYTRSMVADFSPYQQAGIKLSYELNAKISIHFHIMNGWGNLVETNTDKAVGGFLEYRILKKLSTYVFKLRW